MSAQAGLKEVLKQYPAQNLTEQCELSAELMKLGAAKELCTMLVPESVNGDEKARYALHGITWYVGRPGAEKEAKQYSAVLIEALKSAQNKDVKAFLIRQLELAADSDAVPALGIYLSDERLCNPAARALVTIGTPEASGELLDALPKVKGRELIEIINALGTLQEKRAAGAIGKHAGSTDRETRIAAMFALAKIAAPSSNAVLRNGMKAQSAYEQARASSCYFTYLQKRAENGDKKTSIKICRELLNSGKSHIQCSAISTLYAISGADAAADILTAAKSKNRELRVCALKLSLMLKGSGITDKLAGMIAQSGSQEKIEILEILGERGDKTAMSGILPALKDADSELRSAAILASIKLGSVEAVPELLTLLMNSTDRNERQLIQGALPRIKGEKVMALAADALKGGSSKQKTALLGILSTERASAHKDMIFELTRDEDKNVRAEAVKAFGFVAGKEDTARLITLLTDMTSSREQSAVRTVLVSVLQRCYDKNRAAETVFAAMKKAPRDKKLILIYILPKLGGKTALAEVVAGTKSSDAKMRITCVRALAGWSTFEAADALLKLSKNASNETHKILALRGYLRLLEKKSMPLKEKIALYQDAASLVKRPDETRMIIAGLSKLPSTESMRLIVPYLDNETLKSEAALAIAQIVNQQGRNKHIINKEFLPAFEKAAPLVTDEKLQETLKSKMKGIK